MTGDSDDLILAMDVAPGGRRSAPANTTLLVALARAGALPILEADGDDDIVATVRAITSRTERPFAVQPGADLAPAGEELSTLLPTAATTIVLGASTVAELISTSDLEATIAGWSRHRRVLAEITSEAEARAAVDAGAVGLIAKGCESGGRVGSTETFVLLQQTVDLGVPVWARGGIGLHTAAGAVAAGARGVVLDGQLSLVRETNLPAATRAAIAAMDGSETRVIGDHRVYTRPDLPVAARGAAEPSAAIAAELGPDIGLRPVPDRTGRRVGGPAGRPVQDGRRSGRGRSAPRYEPTWPTPTSTRRCGPTAGSPRATASVTRLPRGR